jgi:hypothetical protein
MESGIKPDDILADHQDFVTLNGVTIRKGSIAAFLKNIDLLENPQSSQEEKLGALHMLKLLAPGIIASNLYKHALFKNETVQKILDDSEYVD